MVTKKKSNKEETEEEQGEEEYEELIPESSIEIPIDPVIKEQQALIKTATPKSKLEIALKGELERKETHVERLTAEVLKLKSFISKRKQTYKRKRKDTGAPTRALSAYNIFVKERFIRLSKENEAALQSADTDAVMKRVPPASLVASTGNEWKVLSAEEKSYYEEKAKLDRKRFEDQMAKYQPPEKQGTRKRNKTGYNMFFSAHVLRLKQTEAGVPSERGSVARLVGNAWKELSGDEKQYYEREADRENGLNPVEHAEEEEGGGKKRKTQATAAAVVQPPPEHHDQYANYAYAQGQYGQYPGYDYSQMQGQYAGYYDQRGQYAQGYYQYPDQGQQGA
mmetsp:Transcript_33633/g.73773  ORF Transcript_33633/g.73773 Transcript_33633/m.73773 type:complete len:337 (+) Transcript_33633:325-1335(+)|eukprot:CAMPEP_0178558020 /NCGR_PEP_ID=MMETSP0697-20121206/10193_1 /TAXON_ID=265572 /ORGANISM="Extubocellulus spinifer, Strain CCMP396" /LENGTH=336 /DNA_ID=CAMNT_0020191107 /DNA_START=262 /DNA_END=1272 /DNA_ORIENTATION=-